MGSAIRRRFTEAWQAGAAACGVQPDELTVEELLALETEINQEITYVWQFSVDIIDNRHSDGKLQPLLDRTELWVNAYHRIQNQAMLMACGDKKLKWVADPAKEHCADCQNYDGRVYRASIWSKYGIQPQGHHLACGGWRCGCVFQATDDPVTPGRPPRPNGS
jgi:hypothetical protein